MIIKGLPQKLYILNYNTPKKTAKSKYPKLVKMKCYSKTDRFTCKQQTDLTNHINLEKMINMDIGVHAHACVCVCVCVCICVEQ